MCTCACGRAFLRVCVCTFAVAEYEAVTPEHIALDTSSRRHRRQASKEKDEDDIHIGMYKLRAFGDLHQLNLKPNRKAAAVSLPVQILGDAENTTIDTYHVDTNCLYHGYVEAHGSENSEVAVINCNNELVSCTGNLSSF